MHRIQISPTLQYTASNIKKKKCDRGNCDQNKRLGHWHRGCSLVVRERKVAVLIDFYDVGSFFFFGPYNFDKDGGRNRPTIMYTPTLEVLSKFQSKSSITLLRSESRFD